jgi:hypothetical protein
VILSDVPVVTAGKNYTVTCDVKGTAGVLQLSYDTQYGPTYSATSPGQWVKANQTFTAVWGGQVSLDAWDGIKGTAPVHWKISGCEVHQCD